MIQGNVVAFTDATELFENMSDLNDSSTFQGDIKKMADEGGAELAVELRLVRHVLDTVSKRLAVGDVSVGTR
jgi:hypothetical protein